MDCKEVWGCFLMSGVRMRHFLIVPSSRTDFYVDMSGQSSSRRRQLSTKQWSGNKCSDVPTKIQLRVTQCIIRFGRVNGGGLSIKHATALAWQRAFRKQSSLFEGLFYLYNLFVNASFLFKNSTLCRQNRIFCRYVVFSQNCCFVANFVNKALVNDSTTF